VATRSTNVSTLVIMCRVATQHGLVAVTQMEPAGWMPLGLEAAVPIY